MGGARSSGVHLAAVASLASATLSCSRAPSSTAPLSGEGSLIEAGSETENSASPFPSAPSSVSPSNSATAAVLPLAASGEARRKTLARLELDPLLTPHLGMLREHFGRSTGAYTVQRSDLAGGRTALLLSHADEADPIVLVVDRDQLLWSKPRPTAGILPPVRHLALAPRPDGGVVVFGWVETLRSVAARMWADDSNPFGDFELFEPDACDALSAAYGPGLGWIVACSSRGGTRVQRLREDGTSAWGHYGVPLGAPSAAGPATIVFDTPSTVMLLQRAAAAGGQRLLAFRYDAEARDLWDAPADLRETAPPPGAVERIEARTVSSGLVRVDPSTRPGRSGAPLEIDSSGQVLLPGRPAH
jgi:hypothetical protein